MSATKDLFVPLGVGIQTDIDDHLLPVGKALDVQNMTVLQTGNLVKRFGTIAETTALRPNGGTLPTTWQLAQHKGSQVSLSAPANPPIGLYEPNGPGWSVPMSGTPTSASALRGPIQMGLIPLASSGVSPSIAYSGGTGNYFVLYSQLTAGSSFTNLILDVYDATTFHLVTSQTLSSGVAYQGYDLVFCNGYAVAVWADNAAGIRFAALNPALNTVTTALLATLPDGTEGVEAIVSPVNSARVQVVFASNTDVLSCVDFDPATLTVTGWSPLTAAGTAVFGTNLFCWVRDLNASGKLGIAVYGVLGLRTLWDLPSTGATRQAVSTYTMTATIGSPLTMTAYTTASLATGAFQILTTQNQALGTNNFTTIAQRTTGGTVTGNVVLFRSMTLTSRAWLNGTDVNAIFSFNSTTQGNSYVLNIPASGTAPTTPAPQAQFAIGQNVSDLSFFVPHATAVVPISSAVTPPTTSSTLVTVQPYRRRVNSQGDGQAATIASQYGVQLVAITHPRPTDIPITGAPAEIADSLMVPGGVIGQFDGTSFAEMGFAYAPENGTLAATGGGGALTPGATYFYQYVYSYPDAQGRLWRSPVSVQQSVTMGANAQVTLQVPTLRITGRTTCAIEIYRGAANDNVNMRKVSEIPNQTTVDTISYVDNISDAALAVGEVLYTNGGILSNDTIPGSPFVFAFQNRIWFISADNPTQVFFSNQITPTNGPRFSNQNVVSLADAHGAAYAVGVMDDKLVAIKRDAVYTWSGLGPDGAGNGSFSPPTIVALGIGTIEPRSLVSYQDGVMFDSSSTKPGIQMITRALAVAKDADGLSFGAAVLRYANEQIMSAILVPEQSQARFYCASGRVFVYDIVSNLWTTFLMGFSGIVSAISFNGAAVIAATNGTAIFSEDATGATYTDNAAPFTTRTGSPWIQIDGVLAFQRLMELIGVGRTKGDHTLTVDMYLDFDDSAPRFTKTFSMTVASTPKWNWEWIPRTQRMSAIRFVITETSTTQGFQCNGIAAKLATKSGLSRQATVTRG